MMQLLDVAILISQGRTLGLELREREGERERESRSAYRFLCAGV